MDRVIFFGSVRGGVVDMLLTRVFFDRPCCAPSGWGRSLLNLVIFGNCASSASLLFGVVVLGGLFLVGFRAFHGLVSC